uniref:PK_C domain-containing protein n=1 Tax=Angiostrongylus cantonensis TaxID=6313 RepID=A0A0K0D8A5_ANGCA
LLKSHIYLSEVLLCELIQRTYPQVRTYIGTSNTVCHMLREKRPICCLQLDKACQHCSYTSAHEYKWANNPIILAADKTSSGMYNLIIPLRAYYRPIHELHPIVLLLELEETANPNPTFLDAISYFPGIFWMQGKISVLDNLLRAGVSRAEHVVVVKETASLGEEHFADCNTIITVQKIHR